MATKLDQCKSDLKQTWKISYEVLGKNQIAPFFKYLLGGACPEPPLQMRIPPLFQKYFKPPPPPPQNEILGTPLMMT